MTVKCSLSLSLQKAKYEGQIAELKQKCQDEQEEVRNQWCYHYSVCQWGSKSLIVPT